MDKESSKTALSIVDTKNQLKSALGNGYYKSRWSALIIVDKESGKSLPWEMWKRNPAKVCLGYLDKKSIILAYFGQEIWEKFLLGNEA